MQRESDEENKKKPNIYTKQFAKKYIQTLCVFNLNGQI